MNKLENKIDSFKKNNTFTFVMKRVLYSIILFSSIGIPTAFSSPSKDHNTDSSDFDPETSTVDDNGPLNFVAENTEKPSTPTYARKQLLLTKKFNPSVLERFRGKGSSDVPKQSTVGKLANSTINLFDGNKKEEGPYSTNLKKIRSLVCKILLQKRQGIGPNEISLNRRLSEGIQSRIQGKQSIEALAKEVVQWLEAQPFSSLSPELKNSLNEIKKFLQSLTQVDVEKYIAANPVSRLGDIPEDAKIQTLKLLGQGGMGEIHAARITNNNKVQDVVVKKAKEKFQKDLEKEIAVGNELKEKYHSISSDTLLSEIQGLRGIVLPQKLQNMAIQEKINGKNGLEAICSDRPLKFYKNGFVANPQKALQFICQLLAELYALHANGKVHCDLKLENIMIEGPLKNSIDEDEYIIRIIDLGLAANIGDDAELGTGSLNGAPEIMSPPNCEEPDKNKVKVSPAADIYAFGTMLPTLLFGKGAGSVRESSLLSFTAERSKNDGSILPSEFVKMYKAWEIEAYEAIGKELVKNKYGVTTDQPLGLLRKQKKGNGGGIADGDDGYEYAIAEDDIVNHNIAVKINEKTSTIESILDTCSVNDPQKLTGILVLLMIHKELLELTSNAFNATMFGGTLGKVFNIIIMINGSRTRTGMKKKLEDAIAKYAREAFTKEMSQMPPELLREIETEAKKTLPELLQEIETEAKKTLPKLLQEIETKAKETAKNKVDEYVLQMFKTADENMKNQAKVSYPESVLETLAKITADCLSLQPELRPTAEGIFGQFQDLAFSDWGKGYYRIQTSDKSIRSSDNILEVIWPKDEN